MASLSPIDFFPKAKADQAARAARAAKGGPINALKNALGDFVSMNSPVPGVGAPMVPAVIDNQQPVPPNMQAALPGTLPAFYYGPPPAGFLPNEPFPNVDGAVFSCCPTLASQMPVDNNPAVFGNAMTTVAALSNTLAPFAPPVMEAPRKVFDADLAIAGAIQAGNAPKIPAIQIGNRGARPGMINVAVPKSIQGAFNLISTKQIAMEPEQTTSEVAMFAEKSYMPGTGQGGNSITDKDKVVGLMGVGGAEDEGVLPGWAWAAGLVGLGLWYWKK